MPTPESSTINFIKFSSEYHFIYNVINPLVVNLIALLKILIKIYFNLL